MAASHQHYYILSTINEYTVGIIYNTNLLHRVLIGAGHPLKNTLRYTHSSVSVLMQYI